MNFVGNLSLFKMIFKSYNLAKHFLQECKYSNLNEKLMTWVIIYSQSETFY